MRTLGSHTSHHSSIALRATADGDRYDVVLLDGQLDMNTQAFARTQVLGAADLTRPALVLDLGGLDFLDSSGIRALVLIHRELTARGTTLLLVTDSAHLRKLLRISGLDQVVAVHETLEQVLGAPAQDAGDEAATAG